MPAHRRALVLLIACLLLLSGCALPGQSPQIIVVDPLAGRPIPDPTNTDQPIPPTPTAVTFQLKPSSTPLPTGTPFAVSTPVFGYGPSNFPAGINPLTGLQVADPNLLERRPMAIKVTNYPRSVRPQWGLTRADNVYEYYLENEITRFIAVFYGNNAERVGPVRSGRFFDENIVRMYKSIFVFASADPRVLDPWLESDLKNFLVIERPDNCPPLCRIGSKYNYNTLYTDTQKLSQFITDRGTDNAPQDLSGFRFEPTTPYSLMRGIRLFVNYSFTDYNRWEYNPDTGRYLRFSEDADEAGGKRSYQPLKDSLTGEQISADNLVVLLIPHEYFVHTKTTEMVKMKFLGRGQAYAFRDGQAYPVVWERTTQESLLSLLTQDGRPYPFKPGNVWFQVIGSSSAVTQLPDESWQFDFKIP
jgi:hypothetical protein